MTVADQLITETAPGCPVADGVMFNPFITPDFSHLHPMLARLRQDAPVYFSDDFHMWVVTRHEDALDILRDPDTFSSSTRPVILSQFVDEARQILEQTHTFAAPNMGFDADPDHDRLRRPVAAFFSAKGVTKLEPRIRELALQQLEQIPETTPVDLYKSFAGPLASQVLIDICGLPLSDYDLLMRYHDAVAAFFFGNPSPEEQLQRAPDVRAFEEYLADFIARRRQEPGDDLTSYLLQKIARGDAVYSDAEVIGFLAFDVITAGTRPTAYGIGNLCRELLLNDRLYWNRVQQNPRLFDDAFSESLRRTGLSLGVFRQATRDVEVNGTVIPAGGVVWVFVCSTSHDEAQFPKADIFDPHRENLGSSLAFSHGLHYCLGRFLAREVARVGLDVLMRRYPDMRLVPDQIVDYEPSINLMIPTSLLVEW